MISNTMPCFLCDSTDWKHANGAKEAGRAEPRAQRRLFGETAAPESKSITVARSSACRIWSRLSDRLKTPQSKLFDHDNMKYLKKLLDELENVMDQVETELQRRVEETPGTSNAASSSPPYLGPPPPVATIVSFDSVEEGGQSWLCGDFFSMADVSLAVTLHRLKFLGLSRRYWGNGNRANLETYYERVVERPAFRRVLGHVNNILISAVLPVAFRVARKNAPVIFSTTLIISVLGGAAYLAFLYMKKRLIVFS